MPRMNSTYVLAKFRDITFLESWPIPAKSPKAKAIAKA